MKNNIIAIRPDELIEARFNLTSKENNIIDMILNIIKDDKKYIYDIDLEKYKKLFKDGSTNMYRDMKRATKDLFKKHNNFTIKNKATGEEFDFVWFSMLHYNDKEGSINFEIGDTLKKLLLDIKKRIYYDLRYTLNFRSIYSKRMYYMLKSFEDTGWRLDKIEDLKYKLKCPESYKNYAIFKQKVLDIADKEINGNSDITFSCQPIKTGRKVTSIKFTIVSNKAKNEISATKLDTVDEAPKEKETYIENVILIIKSATGEDFTDKLAIDIYQCATKNEKYGSKPLELIKEVAEYSKTQSIKGFIGWFKSTVTEYKRPIGTNKTTKFNDYEQRSYDYDDLEKKLLGWK